MTRVSKSLVLALVVVLVASAAGAGGYLLGRSSRSDATRDATMLRSQRQATEEDLRRFGARSGGMLRRLCEQVVKLPNRASPRYPLSASDCRLPTNEPKGGYTLHNIDSRMTRWVVGLCRNVELAEGLSPYEEDSCVTELPQLTASERLGQQITEDLIRNGQP
jgi:hypothetical protein